MFLCWSRARKLHLEPLLTHAAGGEQRAAMRSTPRWIVLQSLSGEGAGQMSDPARRRGNNTKHMCSRARSSLENSNSERDRMWLGTGGRVLLLHHAPLAGTHCAACPAGQALCICTPQNAEKDFKTFGGYHRGNANAHLEKMLRMDKLLLLVLTRFLKWEVFIPWFSRP